MSGPILTIYNQHTAGCGIPPAFTNESADLYIGDFANRHGEQWIFTFDRATREARLRRGDVGWASVHTVHEGRVDGLILVPEEVAWLQACWRAAAAWPRFRRRGARRLAASVTSPSSSAATRSGMTGMYNW